MDYPLIVAILSGWSFYACWRWNYWRKRALHTEECLAISAKINQVREDRHQMAIRSLIGGKPGNTKC